jgi:hypothetical protein
MKHFINSIIAILLLRPIPVYKDNRKKISLALEKLVNFNIFGILNCPKRATTQRSPALF